MSCTEGQRCTPRRCAPVRSSWQMRSAVIFALMLSIVFSCLANSQTPAATTPAITTPVVIVPAAIESEVMLVPSEGDQQPEKTLEQMLEPLAAGVVQIRNRDRLCCLGTIVAKGLVVSKRSELSGSLTCVMADGSKIQAVVVASDQVDDLALVQMIQPMGEPGKFPAAVKLDGDSSVESGDILFSVGTDVNPISVGVATVAPQRIPVAQPACRDCADLGVTVSAQSEAVMLQAAKLGNEWLEVQKIVGARVKRVYPRTVGERVGMLQGDLLVSINQQWVPNAAALRSIGARVRVGQTLNVLVVRDGALKQLRMKIDHFLRRVYHDRWGGGPFSERRFGFNTTIVHDSLIEPSQCGGPLVDVDGNVVGVNIARSMRVATLAVPVDRVREFVARFRYLPFYPSN